MVPPSGLAQRPDILVHAEEVLWIVFVLDLLEPSKVGPIGCGNRVARLIVAQVIHVPARGDERLHRSVGLARPGNAPVGIFRVDPFADEEEVVTGGAMWEGRLANSDAGNSTMDVLQDYLGHWRRAPLKARNHR